MTIRKILDKISQNSGWDNWSEVVFSGQSRIIMTIFEEMEEEIENQLKL